MNGKFTFVVQGRRFQRGVSMIEVLVTVAVIAVGLIGIGAMQLIGMQSNQGAYYRTQATYVAYEVTDSLRSNRGAVQAGGIPAAAVAIWDASAAALLPEGSVAVSVDNAAAGIVTVTVQWLDDRADAAPNGGLANFVLTTRI